MNASGSWFLANRAFEVSLKELKAWRDAAADALTRFRRWALVARLVDEHTAARIAHLERRLASERLTIAFVAEYSRGKSELINALFFADLGRRLLPSGEGRTTRCPAEILHDPSRPPSIRLLAIETRESPKALREFIAESASWKEIALDPSQPEQLASALGTLSESLTVTAAEAVNLGLAAEPGTRVEIPRWRYAIVNFPHPLLTQGLAILDTPGLAALGAEPELTLHRVPEADAIVFMLAVDSGAERADRDLWEEHVAPIGWLPHTRFVVLNKIDQLRDAGMDESRVLSEIDRLLRETAEALKIDPTRIFALSARQGLAAKIQGDRDALVKSRLYRLEQALSQGLLHHRRVDHATTMGAEMRATLGEARALLESRRAFALEQFEELSALQGKNQKLVESLARRSASERTRIAEARAAMAGLRAVHNRHSDELNALLDPAQARAAGARAREALQAAAFSRGIGEALDAYFQDARGRIGRAVELIAEVKAIMAATNRKFVDEYGIAVVETPDFSTERFGIELDRLEARCAQDFRSAASLITKRRKTLGTLFFDTIALQVIHVFEIADREVRAWMNGFIRPLEAQINAFQEQANSRIEGMGRIQNAETDLLGRLEELRAIVAEVDAQMREWDGHRERIAALLDVRREPSLA